MTCKWGYETGHSTRLSMAFSSWKRKAFFNYQSAEETRCNRATGLFRFCDKNYYQSAEHVHVITGKGGSMAKSKAKVAISMQLSRAIEGYFLEKERVYSKDTIRAYRGTLKRFCDFVNDIEIDELSADHIRRYLRHLEDGGMIKSSVARAWSVLSSFFTWASTELGIQQVVQKVARPIFNDKIVEAYTELEMKAMLESCGHTSSSKNMQSRNRASALRDGLIIRILFDTGLRASELCALEVRDYNQAQRILKVRHGKGGKERIVVVGLKTQQCLWKYLAARGDVAGTEPLIITRNNTPISRVSLLDLVVNIARRAGVKNANVHKFRHSFAINFLRNGGNPLELKELLGHEKLETVMIYVKYAQVDLVNAHKRASPVDRWNL